MASRYACWCIGHSKSGSDPRIPTSWTKCCFLSAPKGFNLRFRDVERNVKQRRLLMPWCLLWFRLQVGPFKFVESDRFQLIVGGKSQFFKNLQSWAEFQVMSFIHSMSIWEDVIPLIALIAFRCSDCLEHHYCMAVTGPENPELLDVMLDSNQAGTQAMLPWHQWFLGEVADCDTVMAFCS